MRLNSRSEHSFKTVAMLEIDGLSAHLLNTPHARADGKGLTKSEVVF